MKPKSPNNKLQSKDQNEKELITKDDFIKALNKAIRYTPKASRRQGKKRTSE